MNNTEMINTINIIHNYNKQKIYHMHNDKGLGDNVFNIILFRIIMDFIIHNNIKIYYYTKQEYIKQLQEFIYDNPNIILTPLNKKPYYSLELWINTNFFGYTHIYALSKSNTKILNYNHFYKKFFNIVLKKIKFNISISKLVYCDDDLLNRYNLLPEKYKKFDILIINSTPFSGQYAYNKNIWDKYIIELDKRFKVLTTTKVDGVLCSYDDNLTIKDIASLSVNAKVIIAINSGVLPGLLNCYTLKKVKHFYIFDNRSFYSYPNFENKNNINDITFEELQSYLN